jgi:hypothetical protein
MDEANIYANQRNCTVILVKSLFFVICHETVAVNWTPLVTEDLPTILCDVPAWYL